MSSEKTLIIDTARTRIEALRLEAKERVEEHWDYYIEESKKRTNFDEKSKLFPRVGKTKNGFAIEWYFIRKWFKNHKGDWKKITRYVPGAKATG